MSAKDKFEDCVDWFYANRETSRVDFSRTGTLV